MDPAKLTDFLARQSQDEQSQAGRKAERQKQAERQERLLEVLPALRTYDCAELAKAIVSLAKVIKADDWPIDKIAEGDDSRQVAMVLFGMAERRETKKIRDFLARLTLKEGQPGYSVWEEVVYKIPRDVLQWREAPTDEKPKSGHPKADSIRTAAERKKKTLNEPQTFALRRYIELLKTNQQHKRQGKKTKKFKQLAMEAAGSDVQLADNIYREERHYRHTWAEKK